MPVSVGLDSFSNLTKAISGDIAAAATAAMRETTPETKRELREQIVSSGLGQRLANTWRDRVYPQGRKSVTPTGYIWSNAPDIVDSFVRGATIVPVAGSRYLAIPTEKVPLRRGRGKRRTMTPAEVEHEYNQSLTVLRGKRGSLLGFVDPMRGRGARVKRPRGSGKPKLVLMFTFVRAVRMPKLLDLDGPAERWTRRFETSFAQRLEP